MKGKIILNLAISIDGFIADEDGGFAWIHGDSDKTLNTVHSFDFALFLSNIDIVVMGSSCYEQGFAKDFPEKTVYVATSQKHDDYDNIKFINGDIVSILQEEKHKNIYLFGGGKLIQPFIESNSIDEYIIAIIPTLLGRGRKLFSDKNPTIELHLKSYNIAEGVVILHYTKRA